MNIEELLASKAALEKVISTLQGQMKVIDAKLKKYHPEKDANSLNMARGLKERTVTRLQKDVTAIESRISRKEETGSDRG